VDPVLKAFDPGYNVVMIDENFFNEDKDKRSIYVLPDEDLPKRTRSSKTHIGKTMFLADVARPR
jgi:hypothetical protein